MVQDSPVFDPSAPPVSFGTTSLNPLVSVLLPRYRDYFHSQTPDGDLPAEAALARLCGPKYIDWLDDVHLTASLSQSVEIRDAARRYYKLHRMDRVLLAYEALNALGSVYAWPVHAHLTDLRAQQMRQRRPSRAKTTVRMLSWLSRQPTDLLGRVSEPVWPIDRPTATGETITDLAARFGTPALIAHLNAHREQPPLTVPSLDDLLAARARKKDGVDLTHLQIGPQAIRRRI